MVMVLENPFHARHDEFTRERDTNKLLGDTIFWQHYEKIPVRFVYKAGSIEYRNLKLMLLEMIFYLSIVTSLTAFMYNHIDASLEFESRQQQQLYWGQCTSDESQRDGCRIDEVTDISSFWNWYQDSLIPLAFNVVGEQDLLQQALLQSRSADDDASSSMEQYPSLAPSVTPPAGWLNEMAPSGSTLANGTSLDSDLSGLDSATTPVWPEHVSTLFVPNEESIAFKPRYVGDTKTNILVGSIRIRQVAVTPQKGCAIQDDLLPVHSVCFGSWSHGDQYKLKIANIGTPERVRDAYVWRSKSETTQKAPMIGKNSHEYTGDGYTFDLPEDIVQAFRVGDDLQEWEWLDMATRAVIIELSTLNPNTNMIVSTRLLFEFGPDGSVGVKQEHTPLPIDQISLPVMLDGGKYLSVFFYQIVITGQFLIFTLYFVTNLYKARSLRYFKYIWSIVDFLIIILFFSYLSKRLQFLSVLDSEPSLRPELLPLPKTAFMPYSIFREPLRSSRSIFAQLILVVWLKLLKYMTIFSAFRPFVRVIERCICELAALALLCIVLFVGLALPFHVLLSSIVGEFTWMRGSLYALLFMLVRGPTDSIMQRILTEEPQMGKLIFMVYIVLLALLLVPFFFGVVLDVYNELSILEENPDPSVLRGNRQRRNPMMAFLFTYYYKLKGVSLVRDLADDEDVGGPNDQWIELRALPACLAIAWDRKRRELEDELEKSIAAREDEAALRNLALSKSPRGSIFSRLPRRMTEQSKGRDDRAQFEEERQEAQKLLERVQRCDRITRVQLQRLLNESPELCELIGSGRAIEIIRRYKSAYHEERAEERMQRIARMQENIFTKMDKFSDTNTKLKFDAAASMELVSTELNETMTEAQSVWRADMANVLEGIGTFSETLRDLTMSIEEVQLAHTRLATDSQLGKLKLTEHAS